MVMRRRKRLRAAWGALAGAAAAMGKRLRL
jgi:hypothetical protein